MPRVLIAALPCGCLADAESIFEWPLSDGIIVECPWCGVTFRHDEYLQWDNNAPFQVHQPKPSPLLCGGLLLEPVGECHCGAPMVRRDGSKPFHLNVPMSEIEILRD
jgi:hypothetical protein